MGDGISRAVAWSADGFGESLFRPVMMLTAAARQGTRGRRVGHRKFRQILLALTRTAVAVAEHGQPEGLGRASQEGQ